MPIRLVVVDDHPLVLGGLEQLLGAEPDFEIAATCSSIADGWQAVERERPDLLLLDLKLPDGDGFDILRRLDPAAPPAVVILTAVQDDNALIDAVRLGARGVVLKATAPRVLEDCLRAVGQGEDWLVVDGVDLGDRLRRRHEVERQLSEHLTARELEIVRLADLGLDNDDISTRLSISVGTVKIHLHHVFDKLQLRGRQELQQLLRREGY